MKCTRCDTTIEHGEEREQLGRILCEDCYMDVLSPSKACDPWAVHSAKSLEKHTGSDSILTPLQSEILRILQETGGLEPGDLLRKLEGKLTMSQLEREFASLRHMEKARAEKRNNSIFYRIW